MNKIMKKFRLILFVIVFIQLLNQHCLINAIRLQHHQKAHYNQYHYIEHGTHEQMTQNCTTSYARLFFTPEREKMLIKFNTRDPCSHSYVTIIQNNIGTKFSCNSQMLRVEQKTAFIRYIQTCLVTIQTEHSQFRYVVHGHSRRNLKTSAPKTKDKIYKVNIPHANEDFHLIVTGDWGPIRTHDYQPIYPSLIREINNISRPVHGLVILGDVAYDLKDNQCQQYEIFMSQLQLVSPYLPIITMYGNHELRNPLSTQIFKKTFQLYNMNSITRVQTYKFWNFKFVTFNPYAQNYGESNKRIYSTMKNALLNEIKSNLQTNHFTILSSHYPLKCSQVRDHCDRVLQTMSDIFNQISNLNQVDLYLAGHQHQYERIAPFKNGKFSIGQQGPYGKGRMISIVEGDAGTDQQFIQQCPIRDFSLKHSFKTSGYGLLKISNISNTPSAEYNHYITLSEKETILFDQVKIDTAIKN